MKLSPKFIKEVNFSGHYYRTFSQGSHLGMMGCGFMQKGPHKNILKQYGHYAAIYVLQGKGKYIDHLGNEYPLYPGALFQRLPDLPHTVIVEGDEEWLEAFVALKYLNTSSKEQLEKLNSQVAGKWIHEINALPGCSRQIMESMNLIDINQPVLYPGLDYSLVRKLHDLYRQMKSAPLRQSQDLHFNILSILNQWRQMDSEEPEMRHYEKLVQQACEILEQNCTGRTPIPELLNGLGMSYSQLRAIFRQVMGTSPGQYQVQCRLDRAFVLLTQDKSVKETAALLGYDTAHAFSAQFRKFTGQTPGSVKMSF